MVEGYRRAREAVERALSLEANLAEGHAQLGWLQRSHDWNFRGAEASLRRAMELAPGNALVLRRAAILALNLGRLDEAIALNRRAVEQDPLSAEAFGNLGLALEAAGRLADADSARRKALELAPHRTSTRAHLALTLLARGQYEEALADAMREPEPVWRMRALAIIHRAAGRNAQAEDALRELIAHYAEGAAFQIAEVYAAHDEADLAFEWLERAYTQRDPGLCQMKAQPSLRRLHSDSRWDAFLRKMGLAD